MTDNDAAGETVNLVGVRAQDSSAIKAEPSSNQNSTLRGTTSVLSKLSADHWFWEMLGICASVVAMASICVILAVFDGKAAPRLPHGITLNAIISILAFLARAALLTAVAAAIGQKKWLWFREMHRLVDLQEFDDATRGPLGSLNFMTLRHKSFIAFLGALITLLSVGFEPFLQQMTTYPLKEVVSLTKAAMLKTTWVNHSVGQVGQHLNLPMFGLRTYAAVQSAVYDGKNSPRWQPGCPSEKCIWPPYFSAAFCSKCMDISDQISISRDPHNETLSHYEERIVGLVVSKNGDLSFEEKNAVLFTQQVFPPFGSPIFVQATTFVLTPNYTYPPSNSTYVSSSFTTKMTWTLNSNDTVSTDWIPGIYAGIENPIIAIGYITLDWDLEGNGAAVTEALGCALTLCVNEYNTRIEGTQLTSDILSTHYGTIKEEGYPLNWSVTANDTTIWSTGNDTSADIFTGFGFLELGLDLEFVATGSATQSVDFDCYSSNLTKKFSGCVPHPPDPGYSPNFTEWSTQEFEVFDAFGSFSGAFENIRDVLNDLMHRYGNHEVIGQVLVPQSIVQIHWPWITLPIALLLMGIVTLLLTMLETSRNGLPVWKNSSLPLIYRITHRNSTESVANTVSSMEHRAKDEAVRLGSRDDDGVWKILPECEIPGEITEDDKVQRPPELKSG